MTLTTHPTKEQVREHMQQRARSALPPSAPDQIRRSLSWHVVRSAIERIGARPAPAQLDVPDEVAFDTIRAFQHMVAVEET